MSQITKIMYEYFYTIAISKTVPRVKESVMISTGTLKWVTNVKCRWQNSPISSFIKNLSLGNSLAVQWLGLLSFYCGGLGSICGQATKILQATRLDQKKKKSQTESEFIQSFHSNSELRKSERRYSTWVPQEKAISLKNVFLGVSLVARRWVIHLPGQETWVQSLIQKDPSCRGATKSVCHNHWTCMPRVCSPQQEKPPQWEACSLQLETSPWSNKDTTQPKTESINSLNKLFF